LIYQQFENLDQICIGEQAFALRTGLVDRRICRSEFSIGIKLPRQQLLNPIDGVIGDSRQHHSQVGFWVHNSARKTSFKLPASRGQGRDTE
jgi:hypothetical protein